VRVEVANQVVDVLLEGRNGTTSDSDDLVSTSVNSGRCDAERTLLKKSGSVTTSGREVVQEELAGLASLARRKRSRLDRNVNLAIGQVLGESLVDDTLDTDVGRDNVVFHHHEKLDESVNTRGGLSVTNVCLDGTEVERLVSLAASVGGSKGVGDRGHLNTVTSLGTSTVHLNVDNLVGISTSLSENLLEEELLVTSVRVSDRNSLSGVVCTRTENATQDVVLVGNGIVVTLEDDGCTSITTAVTVSVVVVSLARTSLGQELTLGQTRENIGVGHDVETTTDGSVNITSPEGSAGKLDSGHGRRTGGIHREGRTAELEVVVDTTGSESTHTTSDEVGVDVLSSVNLTPIVGSLTVESTNTVKLGRGSTVGDVTGHLKSLVSGGQSKTTHRVSLSSLTRRHVEETRIKQSRLLDETTVQGVGLVLALTSGIVVSLGVESVRGNFAVDIKTVHEELPKSFVGSSIGETTSHTNDGNLVVLGAAIGREFLVDPGVVVLESRVGDTTSLESRGQAVGNVGNTDSVNLE